MSHVSESHEPVLQRTTVWQMELRFSGFSFNFLVMVRRNSVGNSGINYGHVSLSKVWNESVASHSRISFPSCWVCKQTPNYSDSHG